MWATVPGAANYDAAPVYEVGYHHGLVHVHVARDHVREALYPYGDDALAAPVDHMRGPAAPTDPLRMAASCPGAVCPILHHVRGSGAYLTAARSRVEGNAVYRRNDEKHRPVSSETLRIWTATCAWHLAWK